MVTLCSMQLVNDKCIKISVRSLKIWDHLVDIRIDGNVLLKLILKKCEEVDWICVAHVCASCRLI